MEASSISGRPPTVRRAGAAVGLHASLSRPVEPQQDAAERGWRKAPDHADWSSFKSITTNHGGTFLLLAVTLLPSVSSPAESCPRPLSLLPFRQSSCFPLRECQRPQFMPTHTPSPWEKVHINEERETGRERKGSLYLQNNQETENLQISV